MSRALRLAALCALALGPLCGVACRRQGAPAWPGAPIVLVSIDTLRSDHLPAYGYRSVTTPAIDALRKDSLLFQRAYSHYPMTLPSHVSILSGELPPQNGVRDNSGYHFDAAAHSYLPRLLKQAGFETGAAVSASVLQASTGLGDGFDFYDDRLAAALPSPFTLAEIERAGSETVRIALDWISPRAGKPFFFFLHLYEPHAPYTPPEPFASRFRDHYDGEIATADAALGTFLDGLRRLGVYDRAVIVLLSDHGEGLGEHGEQQHGFFLYRTTLQVPLLLKLPGGWHAGETVGAPVQLTDVAPTLLARAGLPIPRQMHGADLARLQELPTSAPRQIYAEAVAARIHFGWSELTSMIEGKLHTIEGPTPEVFDLTADPGERRNVLADERRSYAAMRQAIREIYKPFQPPQPVDRETAQKLAALGYVGGGGGAGGAAETAGPLPDPRTQGPALRLLESALAAAAEKRWQDAAALYESMLAGNPGMLDVRFLLGRAYVEAGRRDKAEAAFQAAFAASRGSSQAAFSVAQELLAMGLPEKAKGYAELARGRFPEESTALLAQIALARHDTAEALAWLRGLSAPRPALAREVGLALAEEGKTEEALAVLEPLVKQTGAPGEVEPASLEALSVALSDAGRNQEAAGLLSRALAADPRDARAHQIMGTVALRMEQPQEARRHLEQAIALDPRQPVAWNTLGVALFQLGQPEAALAAWQKAIALGPGQYEALLNVGLVSAAAGRRAEARRALERFVATAPPGRFAADLAKARALLRELGG